jgi:glycosyltransferase involved in cell wall biosynthesis
MSNKGWIAYVGKFPFPKGNGSSRRVYGIAVALVESGYDVVVLSEDERPTTPLMISDKKGKGSLSYLGLSERLPKAASAFRKIFQYLIAVGERKVNWLDSQIIKPTYVIYYGSNSAFMLRLILWCCKNNVSLVVDVVEWRDASHMVGGGFFSPFNISDKICMKFLNQRADGLIVISSYLEKYYLKKKANVIRIPTLIDTSHVNAKYKNTTCSKNQLTLAYTGTSGGGKKDLINNVIEALFRINSESNSVRIIMAGPSPKEILCLPALQLRRLSSLPSWIKALGWQTSDKALEIVKNADFMPLLRPQNRVSDAGFPTKFAESLVLGTPVICNLTSDLNRYIHDGVEGFICRDHSVEAFTVAIRRASAMSLAQYADMRKAARAMAVQSFDFIEYVKPLSCFLKKIR